MIFLQPEKFKMKIKHSSIGFSIKKREMKESERGRVREGKKGEWRVRETWRIKRKREGGSSLHSNISLSFCFTL